MNGGDEEVLLKKVGAFGTPLSVAADGRTLVYTIFDVSRARYALWVLPLSGDRQPMPFTRTGANESGAQVSPAGRWIAYVSDETGRNEVYLRPFPSGEGTWRVSTDGGIEPTWRRDGRELFYLGSDRSLMAVALKIDATVSTSVPTRLIETRMANRTNLGYIRNQYVVTSDGQRFLINQPAGDTSSSRITVVINWAAALGSTRRGASAP
jgi:Tol biopolymer transport system component